MGYTGTTNYGFQKPAKENAFTVDDLNNALNKIDETIKNESIESVALDTDDDFNLSIQINKGNGSIVEASTSLLQLSGSLIIQEEMLGATMVVTRQASNQQVYTGNVTPQTIPTGSGSIQVVISQFGSTLTKVFQVSGETLFDISNDEDIVKITVADKWYDYFDNVTIQNINVPSSHYFYCIKNSVGTIKGTSSIYKWNNTTPLSVSINNSFTENTTISTPTYSNGYKITNSGTYTLPKANQKYSCTLCGGGGGGGGGGNGYANPTNIGGIFAGSGGSGGNGGKVNSVTPTISTNLSIKVTIGTGGGGGDGATDIANGSTGSTGGTTSVSGAISVSAAGGGGGGGGHYENHASERLYIGGSGGSGGDGSGRSNLSIRGQSIVYGEGGNGGHGNRTDDFDPPGSHYGSSGETTTMPNGFNIFNKSGNGGDGATGGSASSGYAGGGPGGDGGNGLVINNALYGTGGTGGRGGGGSNIYNDFTIIPGGNGTSGSKGVVYLEVIL